MSHFLSNKTKAKQEADSTAACFASLTGISLKPAYYQAILQQHPEIGFFEIHAENYLSKGGPAAYYLRQIRQDYDITVHGVGLSIGGEQKLDLCHLDKVANLVDDIQPVYFSEHLAWSSHQQNFYNDLLPVRYDTASLHRVCQHIEEVQERMQRQILIENPSSYLMFAGNEYSEIDFIKSMVKRSGCGLLLDINNVEVSCFNQSSSPFDYLDAFPMEAVKQIHLAGHTLDDNPQVPLKIDSHDEAVSNDVWSLYQYALQGMGDCPTLIERDGNLPELTELIAEAQFADHIRSRLSKEEKSHAS
ncbi:DUF692 domain-containing protein [Marinomonas sp. THO17]|uniref:MNIO family bufferin maturase n=1 Tax=Marinomonas sp. THO17 TaxID=3149048 RepID=UPI00336BB754